MSSRRAHRTRHFNPFRAVSSAAASTTVRRDAEPESPPAPQRNAPAAAELNANPTGHAGPERVAPTPAATRPASFALAAGAGIMALTLAVAGCTPPNGTPRAALTTKSAVASPTVRPAADGSSGVLRVRGRDGSVAQVSRGSTGALSMVPQGVPVIAGDIDLVQAVYTGGEVSAYHVIVTTPGRPANVYAAVERSFVELGFDGEDGTLAEDGGSAARPWSMAAGVFAGEAWRVMVGVVPAGAGSATVTYAITPSGV